MYLKTRQGVVSNVYPQDLERAGCRSSGPTIPSEERLGNIKANREAWSKYSFSWFTHEKQLRQHSMEKSNQEKNPPVRAKGVVNCASVSPQRRDGWSKATGGIEWKIISFRTFSFQDASNTTKQSGGPFLRHVQSHRQRCLGISFMILEGKCPPFSHWDADPQSVPPEARCQEKVMNSPCSEWRELSLFEDLQQRYL